MTCKEVVAQEHQATCVIHGNMRVDTQLYEVLMKSCSKNILYVCSKCCKLGSIAKHIRKLESDCEHLMSERLASEHITNEKDESIRAENDKLQVRLEYVEQRLW